MYLDGMTNCLEYCDYGFDRSGVQQTSILGHVAAGRTKQRERLRGRAPGGALEEAGSLRAVGLHVKAALIIRAPPVDPVRAGIKSNQCQ